MTAPITVRAERGRFVATVNADPSNFCVADTAPNALCELLANLIAGGQMMTWGRAYNPQAHALIDYAEAALVDALVVDATFGNQFLVKANLGGMFGTGDTEAEAIMHLTARVSGRIARAEATLFALVALSHKLNKMMEAE